MRSNRGSIVGIQNKSLVRKAINCMSMQCLAKLATNVYADEDGGEGTEPPAGATAPQINFEDLCAKVRADEKRKHQGTIERLRAQVETLTGQHNNDLLRVSELEGELKEANKKLTESKGGDSEEVKVLKGEVDKLTKSLSEATKKLEESSKVVPVSREEVEAEVRKELEAEYEVKTFRATKMAELKDQILVPELVIGTTKEEIEESIKLAVERSNDIKKQLGLTTGSPNGNPAGNKRTPKSPANPSMSKVQDKNYSIDYIASLDPASEEYRKFREEAGLTRY